MLFFFSSLPFEEVNGYQFKVNAYVAHCFLNRALKTIRHVD